MGGGQFYPQSLVNKGKNHKNLAIDSFCGFYFGFTLIEVIAIIILLSVIALITYPVINNLISDSREDLYNKQISELERLSDTWVTKNINKLKMEDGYSYNLSFEELHNQGFIVDENIKNPKTGENLDGCVVVSYNSNNKGYDVNYDSNCTITGEIKKPSINLTVNTGILNSQGIATNDFDVNVIGTNITSYTYCVGTTECEPTIKVNNSIGTITINNEGTTYVCVIGSGEDKNTNKLCKSYKLDKTAVVLGQLVIDGTKGLNGWYVSDVNLSVVDIEGMTSTLNINKITSDTTGTDVVLTTSASNGKTDSKTYTIKVDKTKPTAGTLNINGTKGLNDWYTSNVTLTVNNGTDTTSGHNTTTSSISSITSDTTGTTVTVTTTDNAGNTATRNYSIKVDKTKPTITAKGTSYEIIKGTNNTTSSYFNTPTYSISGGSMSCSPTNTGNLSTGTHTLTCTATGGNGLVTSVTTSLIVKEPEPNAPVLFANMIPIKYENSKWVYANISQEWYNYTNKQWANAVVLNSGITKSVGDEITEDDIALWYVWIPRYKYTIFNGNNESVEEQLINVTFESGTNSTGTVKCTDNTDGSETCTDTTNGSVTNGTSTYTHPAFTFGSTNLTGFWVGKFETSTSDSTCNSSPSSTNCNKVSTIKVIPNVSSWRYTQVANFFTSIQNAKTEYGITNADSHMIKNMEWGAVAYLKQSKYGLGTTDIGINNNSSFITGCGAAAGSSESTTCNVYNTSTGMLASTTGNIYGVYDMSGGASEYAMGVLLNSDNVIYIGNSGFSSTPDSKYYDTYKYDSSQTTHERGKLGDAAKETLSTFGNASGGWYSDDAFFPNSDYFWFRRGGYYRSSSVSGVFGFGRGTGNSDGGNSARAVLTSP